VDEQFVCLVRRRYDRRSWSRSRCHAAINAFDLAFVVAVRRGERVDIDEKKMSRCIDCAQRENIIIVFVVDLA